MRVEFTTGLSSVGTNSLFLFHESVWIVQVVTRVCFHCVFFLNHLVSSLDRRHLLTTVAISFCKYLTKLGGTSRKHDRTALVHQCCGKEYSVFVSLGSNLDCMLRTIIEQGIQKVVQWCRLQIVGRQIHYLIDHLGNGWCYCRCLHFGCFCRHILDTQHKRWVRHSQSSSKDRGACGPRSNSDIC